MTLYHGIRAIHPSGATNRPHIFGFAVGRSGNDSLFQLWNGATDAAMVYRHNSDGQHQSMCGTANHPAYSFLEDKTIGMFRTEDGQLGFAVGGEEVARMTAEELVVHGGLSLVGDQFTVNPDTGATNINAPLTVQGALFLVLDNDQLITVNYEDGQLVSTSSAYLGGGLHLAGGIDPDPEAEPPSPDVYGILFGTLENPHFYVAYGSGDVHTDGNVHIEGDLEVDGDIVGVTPLDVADPGTLLNEVPVEHGGTGHAALTEGALLVGADDSPLAEIVPGPEVGDQRQVLLSSGEEGEEAWGSGLLEPSDIPSLGAGIITDGLFDDARISASSVQQHVDAELIEGVVEDVHFGQMGGIYHGEADLAFVDVAAGETALNTITVTGAQVGDPVAWSVDSGTNGIQDFMIMAYVSSENTVTIQIYNLTDTQASFGTVGSEHTWTVYVFGELEEPE